jgi:hypothetical protein
MEQHDMNVKEAVELAKKHVIDLFSTEGVENVGLEEVEYDNDRSMWHITIGFSRPWDRPPVYEMGTKRSYKVVNISDEGNVVSVKNREITSA